MKLAFSDFKSLLSLLMLSSAWQKSVWHMQLANHNGTSAWEPKQHLTVVFRALSSWMLDNETKLNPVLCLHSLRLLAHDGYLALKLALLSLMNCRHAWVILMSLTKRMKAQHSQSKHAGAAFRSLASSAAEVLFCKSASTSAKAL